MYSSVTGETPINVITPNPVALRKQKFTLGFVHYFGILLGLVAAAVMPSTFIEKGATGVELLLPALKKSYVWCKLGARLLMGIALGAR